MIGQARMFDFNVFKSRKEQVEEYANMNAVPPLPEVEKVSPPAYEVGKTESGDTTLRIGYTTLTMTRSGVQQLIRILEAAIQEESNEPTN
jgi:hypothetical protein